METAEGLEIEVLQSGVWKNPRHHEYEAAMYCKSKQNNIS